MPTQNEIEQILNVHVWKARRRFTPADCPYCEYDRRFPPLQRGGWLQQDNNGPIVPCPICNPDGKHPRG